MKTPTPQANRKSFTPPKTYGPAGGKFNKTPPGGRGQMTRKAGRGR